MSDNDRREREFAREYMEKSKHPGDYAWRRANFYTGQGDYTEADHGEAPQGARW